MKNRSLLILAVFLAATTTSWAQEPSRPPEGATQEEKRAFYQKRAAERAAAEAAAGTARPQTGSGAGDAPVTDWRARREAREAKAGNANPQPPVTDSHAHAASAGKPPASEPVADKAAAAKVLESPRGGRPDFAGGRSNNAALWLSDSPPARGDGASRGGGGMGAMGGMGMGGGRSGPPSKRLWLRAGSDPVKSGFAREDSDAAVDTVLVKPQGPQEGEPLPPAEDGKRNLSFEMPVQGTYRLYVTSRKLQGDVLNLSVAKAEVANFSHGGNEEERAQSSNAPRVLESAPIEIVREKAPDEGLFFQLKSGDEQAFVVLQKGLPLQGARVRFVSNDGWVKEVTSDEQGKVSFQIIRDYFPPWNEFKKRFKANFLIIAEASAAERGTFKDQPYSTVRYQTTLSGSYYPSPDDYRSYAWGLGVGLLIVLFSGTAVYLYRRRRVKPFQEIRFDDAK